MGPYEISLTVVFSILFIGFVLRGVKACAQAVKEKGTQLHKDSCKKALLLMVLALVFFLSALYMIFRTSWFMMIVLITGSLAVVYVIGSGIGANIREH